MQFDITNSKYFINLAYKSAKHDIEYDLGKANKLITRALNCSDNKEKEIVCEKIKNLLPFLEASFLELYSSYNKYSQVISSDNSESLNFEYETLYNEYTLKNNQLISILKNFTQELDLTNIEFEDQLEMEI